MTKKVKCFYFNESLPGIPYAPYPGDLGKKIKGHISEKAWLKWLDHQTILINEHRLNLTDSNSREFLEKEMIGFLFEGKADKPDGFTPED